MNEGFESIVKWEVLEASTIMKFDLSMIKNMIQESGMCKECIESDGHCEEWTQSQGCPIHKCAREHDVQFCGLCKEFPCEWLIQKMIWKPDVIEELTELADLYYKSN